MHLFSKFYIVVVVAQFLMCASAVSEYDGDGIDFSSAAPYSEPDKKEHTYNETKKCQKHHDCTISGNPWPEPTNPVVNNCPKGHYCPIIGVNKMLRCPCPRGGVCPNGTSMAIACPKGFYCPDPLMTNATKCPKGHYCLGGSDYPQKCSLLDLCDDKDGLGHSHANIFAAIGSLAIGALISIIIGSAKFYLWQRHSKFDTHIQTAINALAISRMLPPLASIISFVTSQEDSESEQFTLSHQLSGIDDTDDVPDTDRVRLDYFCNKVELHIVPPRCLGMFSRPTVILQSVSCILRQGKLTAIMGPSGCGKTSFLNVLTGKAWRYGAVKGQVLAAGHPLTAAMMNQLRPYCGFVPQEDVMHENLTVKEIIQFQMEGRLPPGLPATERRQRLAQLLSSLELGHVARNIVWSGEQRGVSGGQRRRVSIGMETVTNPSVLFLDEPTSGLDAAASLKVMDYCSAMAHEHRATVVAVIHQPRYEIFNRVDNLVLLAPGGRVVYSGKASEVLAYFERFGYVRSDPQVNPADFIVDVIAADSQIESTTGHTIDDMVREAECRFHADSEWYRRRMERLRTRSVLSPPAPSSPTAHLGAKDSASDDVELTTRKSDDSSDDHRSHVDEESDGGGTDGGRTLVVLGTPAQLQLTRETPTWLSQLVLFVGRSWHLLYTRQFRKVLAEMVICMIGTTALAVALPHGNVHDKLTQFAFGFLLLSLFCHFAALRAFGPESAVARREIMSGFSVSAYFVGKDLAYLFKVFAFPALFSVQFASIDCGAPYGQYYIAVASMSYACFGSGFLLSAALPPTTAQMAAVLLSFLFLLTSTYRPTLHDVEDGLGEYFGQFITGLSPLRWAYEIAANGELFNESEFIFGCNYGAFGMFGLPTKKLGFAGASARALINVAHGLAYRILALAILHWKNRT